MFSRNDNFKKSRTRTKKYGYLKKKSMKKRTKRKKELKEKKKISKLKRTFKGGAETTVPSMEEMTNTCRRNKPCDIYKHSTGNWSCVDKSRIKVFRVLEEEDDSPVSFSSERKEYNLIQTIPFIRAKIKDLVEDLVDTTAINNDVSNNIDLELLEAYSPYGRIELFQNLNQNREYIERWYNIQNTILSSLGERKAKVIYNEGDERDECKRIGSDMNTSDYRINNEYAEKYTIIKSNRDIDGWGIFCNLIKDSEQNLYLLFSSGRVLPNELLWENEDFKLYLQLLWGEIKSKRQENVKKVILCGHSMGCVVAQRLGYYIFELDKSFFWSTVLVIGSGSFPWITEEKKKHYKNMSNIFIFINTIRTEYKIFKDPTSCNTKESLELYEPYFIIGSHSIDTNTEQKFYFEYYNNERELELTCHPYGNRFYEYLHNWKGLDSEPGYENLLKKIFKIEEIGINIDKKKEPFKFFPFFREVKKH